MKIKSTSRLDDILQNTTPAGFQKYLRENTGETFDTLSQYLLYILAERNLQQASIIRKSNLNSNYANGIFNGNKPRPHRDYIIAICLACEMTLKETQRALKISNAGVLYARNPRDAALIICINQKMYDIAKVNEFLKENHFDWLKGSF